MSTENQQRYPIYRVSKKQRYMHVAFSKIQEYNESIRKIINVRKGKHQVNHILSRR